MAEWNTPKTDWVTNPKNPVAEDFNRIEGNIAFLKGDIETKKGAIVNALNTVGLETQLTDTHAQIANKIVAANQGTKIYTPSTVNQPIPKGFHSGQGYVKGDANLIAANIPVGKTIFGVTGSYSVISKIQRGDATIGADPNYINIPIETVDINKAVVIVRPYYASAGGATPYVSVTRALGYLLNNNTLRLERYSTGNYRQTKVFWEVVTFKDIKSLQKGQVVSTTRDTDISISSVDLNKSLIFFSLKTQSSRDGAIYNIAGVSLTNSTTLTVSHLFGAETVIQWYVVEFY